MNRWVLFLRHQVGNQSPTCKSLCCTKCRGHEPFNTLPNDSFFLYLSNFKAVEEDKLNVIQNICRKSVKCRLQALLLILECFQEAFSKLASKVVISQCHKRSMSVSQQP